jgi:hypothetical protein
MNFLLGKWDDYWSIGNNYYLYFNNDGKIEFLPVDYDMAFGDGFALFDTANVGLYEWGNRNRDLIRLLNPAVPEEWLNENADLDYPLVEKVFEIAEYRQRYESYIEEFINPANGLFLYSEFEKKFNLVYPVYKPYLDNEMNEGTRMYINDRVKRYYYDKTLSVIDQLGLNEADYEIPPFGDLPVGMPAPRIRITEIDKVVPAKEEWVERPANGHFYTLTEFMTWELAESQAMAWGGHLVTVNDRVEELWLRSQFGTDEPFWLGITDAAREGRWVWISGEDVTYTNWARGEPNNYGGNEDAAVINWEYSGRPLDDWIDISENANFVGIVESTTEPDFGATVR